VAFARLESVVVLLLGLGSFFWVLLVVVVDMVGVVVLVWVGIGWLNEASRERWWVGLWRRGVTLCVCGPRGAFIIGLMYTVVALFIWRVIVSPR
jgi:hypothetical protein